MNDAPAHTSLTARAPRRTLRNGNAAHVLTREERARGGRVKAAKRRFQAELVDAADRIVWGLWRAGEEDAAQAVRELFLPQTLAAPWESKRKSPLAKAQARIAELEALVEELLVDEAIDLATAGDLGAAEKLLDSTLRG